LATDSNSKEAVIVDISTLPYTETGYYNAPYWSDGEAIAVKDNVGYLGHRNQIRAFDLSSKYGERSEISNLTLGISLSYITQIMIVDNYAYATLYNDWDELVVVDISDPYNMEEVAYSDVNAEQAYDIYVSEDGNRVYYGTNNSWYGDELFIIDSTDKSGLMPVISSYNTNGTSVYGIIVVDQRVIIVGEDGEEYQVVDISDEENPVRCGGADLDTQVNDIQSVTIDEDYVFSYITADDDDGEFRVIRGGEGEGGGGGIYAQEGVFESDVLDTGIVSATYLSVDWEEVVPTDTQIRVQIRTGSTPDISAQSWYGSSGPGSYFTNSVGSYLNGVVPNGRYVQYRVELSTFDIEQTPVFENITISYEE
jgi:hypothetical protein